MPALPFRVTGDEALRLNVDRRHLDENVQAYPRGMEDRSALDASLLSFFYRLMELQAISIYRATPTFILNTNLESAAARSNNNCYGVH